jgi:hypothetical protein
VSHNTSLYSHPRRQKARANSAMRFAGLPL